MKRFRWRHELANFMTLLKLIVGMNNTQNDYNLVLYEKIRYLSFMSKYDILVDVPLWRDVRVG